MGLFPTVRRLLLVLPYDMSVRTFLSGPLLRMLCEEDGVQIHVVSRSSDEDRTRCGNIPSNVVWHDLVRPFRGRRSLRILWSDFHFILGYFLHLALVYRFNAINRFRGFLDRLKQSPKMRQASFREGLPSLARLGFPFPESVRLFHLLQTVYWSGLARHVSVSELFDMCRPDTVVLFHCQNHFVAPYVQEAKHRGTALLGINGSWDQPTTKGPLVCGLKAMAAQSKEVRAELIRFHDMAASAIHVVGWPQMDLYAEPETFEDRAAFLRRIGLAPTARYILVGAYSERLGRHEPDMCLQLAKALKQGAFGPDSVLYIRCHPLELEWEKRFATLTGLPRVVVEPPQLGDLSYLANLIRHAACVIASAGTINIDAVALDVPSIAVAFEDENEPYFDRPARRYDMEHFATVLADGGLHLVRSQSELHMAIASHLEDSGLDGEGRQRLRAHHLEPLDGRSTRRLADFILKEARL